VVTAPTLLQVASSGLYDLSLLHCSQPRVWTVVPLQYGTWREYALLRYKTRRRHSVNVGDNTLPPYAAWVCHAGVLLALGLLHALDVHYHVFVQRPGQLLVLPPSA
jgi:hypothetical protein